MPHQLTLNIARIPKENELADKIVKQKKTRITFKGNNIKSWHTILEHDNPQRNMDEGVWLLFKETGMAKA
ncbi:uncharacterized protein BDR25DRAFT_358641 [Lindgomyces ingoldianus]|uniref:Uncharacterized protein n=1 Tax=Lindgomyces ingoldianus TaxID=673940 RepID=A0ACB6QKL4_9PLEO|nr:uncharacterized protein BDR25DRAFT_358641 [Lindgomyces ingoldianus]KAF2467533.1 hypothetical protein BDR25DRAFT_358641 [Lindgomyces ingoldianus]